MDILPMENFWAIVAVVLFVLEIITPATIFIFPSIVAVIVGLIGLFVDNFVIQIILFFVLSISSIMMIRPLFVTGKKNEGYKQGPDALLAQKVRVIESIDNLTEVGKIKHGADIFPAKSLNGDVISEGEWVEIVKIEGITTFVEKIEK